MSEMKISRLFIKFIKIAICLTLFLGALIPSVTFIYKKVLSGGKHVASEYFSLDYVSVKMDHFYAKSVVDDIRSCIADYTKQHTLFSFNTKELYAQLRTRCKLIKDFDCHIRVPKSVEIVVSGVQPYCVINDTYILGDKHRLFARECFADVNCADLSQVNINPELCSQKISESVFDFLHKIPLSHWQHFNITYHSSSHIELVPKASKCLCTLVVDEESFFDENKFKAVGNVFDDMVKRGFLLQKTLAAHDSHVTFDLRFDRRVVVRCKDGFNKRGTGL